MMQQKEKSYQEHVKKLTEKMKDEQKQLLAEQENIIAAKLRVTYHIISVHSCAPMKNKCIRELGKHLSS
jgi:hypothetical protein